MKGCSCGSLSELAADLVVTSDWRRSVDHGPPPNYPIQFVLARSTSSIA